MVMIMKPTSPTTHQQHTNNTHTHTTNPHTRYLLNMPLPPSGSSSLMLPLLLQPSKT